jgi:hypothetical protein
LTRNGIEPNLSISPYTVVIGDLTFYFSSMLHLGKFMDGYLKHRETVADTLSNRYELPVTADILADVIFYRKIETRGFLIDAGGLKVWQPAVILGGEVRTNDSLEML